MVLHRMTKFSQAPPVFEPLPFVIRALCLSSSQTRGKAIIMINSPFLLTYPMEGVCRCKGTVSASAVPIRVLEGAVNSKFDLLTAVLYSSVRNLLLCCSTVGNHFQNIGGRVHYCQRADI